MKRKLKFSLILLMLLAVITCTLSFADDETTANDAAVMSLDTESISDESTTTEEESSEEDLLSTVQEYYKEYYAEYLGEGAISGDIYKMDTEEIKITESVSGNVFVFGDKVTISSDVIHGDVYVFATDVTISAYEIAGSVYVCAENLKISNCMINYSLYAAADNIDFYGASLDMYATANTITLQKDSCVQRDLRSTSNTLNLYGAVCRDAYVNFEKLNVLSEEDLSNSETISGVFGNLEYSAPESTNLPKGFVGGETKYTKLETTTTYSATYTALSILESVIFMFVVLAVLSIFAKKFIANSPSILANHLGKVILKGLLFFFLIPVIFVLLCILGITVRAALVLLGIYFILLSVASTILVIALANLISNKLKFNNKLGRIGIFILTTIIYAALIQVPYAGPIIAIAAGILGLGIIMQSLSSKKEDNNNNTVVTVTAEVESPVEETTVEVEEKSDENNTDVEVKSEEIVENNVDPIENKDEDNSNEENK